MTEEQQKELIAKKMIDMIDWVKNPTDLFVAMGAMTYTIGSLVCELPKKSRESAFKQLAKLLEKGWIDAEKSEQ